MIIGSTEVPRTIAFRAVTATDEGVPVGTVTLAYRALLRRLPTAATFRSRGHASLLYLRAMIVVDALTTLNIRID
jgi:hypothetical protein